MDNRTDPIEIIARVSESAGKERAWEVWRYKAEKEGWPVVVETDTSHDPGDVCGVVEIEGLRYRVRHSPRVRGRVSWIPPGQHLIAAAVEASLGRSVATDVTWEFRHAAWAEPVL